MFHFVKLHFPVHSIIDVQGNQDRSEALTSGKVNPTEDRLQSDCESDVIYDVKRCVFPSLLSLPS